MRIKTFFLASTLFLILSCSKHDKLMVKDLADNDVDMLKSKKEMIIIVSNGMVCHDCVINLNEFIKNKYNLTKYDYYLLYEDPKTIPGRRWAVETYKNDYTRGIQKIFFTLGDTNIQNRLNITENMFKQLTPYLIYIGPDKQPKYFSFETIFNQDRSGTVRKSFRIK